MKFKLIFRLAGITEQWFLRVGDKTLKQREITETVTVGENKASI